VLARAIEDETLVRTAHSGDNTQETIDGLNDSSLRAKYRMPYSMPYNVLDA
jgi:hypothetical protein